MGIKGLSRLLKETCSQGINKFSSLTNFLQYENRRLGYSNKPYIVAIDTSIYAFHYKKSLKNIAIEFIKQFLYLLSHHIVPIYIFDGTSPCEKKNTIRKRIIRTSRNKEKIDEIELHNHRIINNVLNYIESLKEQLVNECGTSDYNTNIDLSENNIESIIKYIKKAMYVTFTELRDLKQLFEEYHIPFLVSRTESDDLISILYQNHIIDACLSDDMDMLPKNCGNLIQINGSCIIQYLLNDILDSLHLSYEQFVDMCILLGSNYKINKSKLKPLPILKIFQELYSSEPLDSPAGYEGEKSSNSTKDILDNQLKDQLQSLVNENCHIRSLFMIDKTDINNYLPLPSFLAHLKTGPLACKETIINQMCCLINNMFDLSLYEHIDSVVNFVNGL
jgi:5'-3' exonuclease